MVVKYTIAGRQFGSHVLAMATLGTTFTVAFLTTRGGKKPDNTPPIRADSSEEENFIKEFLAKAEAESKVKQ